MTSTTHKRTVTAEAADLHLTIKPGTDIALYNEMLNVMLHELLAVLRHPSDNRNPL